MKRKLLSIILLGAVLLSACASSRNIGLAGGAGGGGPMETYEMAPAAPAVAMDYAVSEESFAPINAQLPGNSATAASQQRLVIQNAQLEVVVKDPQAKMEAVTELAQRMGGFVVSSRLYEAYTNRGGKAPEVSITIRVPAENLDEALKEIKADAVEVQSESRSGQDVTDQYTDLKSRLKNYEAAEQELSRLMEKAETSEDVVLIFQQLAYYREQIEVTKGQIQYYEQSAALSSIEMRLIAEESIQPLEVAGWKPQGVAREAIQDLIYFLQDFADFLIRFFLYGLWVMLLIGLTIAVPIWIVVAIIRYFLRRFNASQAARRAESLRKAQAQAPASASEAAETDSTPE